MWGTSEPGFDLCKRIVDSEIYDIREMLNKPIWTMDISDKERTLLFAIRRASGEQLAIIAAALEGNVSERLYNGDDPNADWLYEVRVKRGEER